MSLKILPLELILSILENLDWSEILVIRQTCKLLNQASRERTVLQSWVARCMLNIPRAAFRLERPISRYTSEELEVIIRRWKAAEQGWVTERRGIKTRPNIPQPPTHTQRQIHTDRPSKAFHLVQGGRWLLVRGRWRHRPCYATHTRSHSEAPMDGGTYSGGYDRHRTLFDAQPRYIYANMARYALGVVLFQHL
ncbi:hypothetical protein GALMADRAFT_1062940 [Galerina marginata CBS 339.88]|uniref:F-box domain-containing protein n=1 Tax=Galerina marginata (strain CBS 339.88) TaxID=685588 RepID=A0A067SM00_GALM3|nr:hypothetical protein GALMADRAFT_1062940 [Galerina marginata CBS 339.88]